MATRNPGPPSRQADARRRPEQPDARLRDGEDEDTGRGGHPAVALARRPARLLSRRMPSDPSPSPAGTALPDPTDARLAAQYEAYPYPQRDPREEARRLIVGSPGHLREVDHWVFAAARPATQPLACLFAGGGTGDGTLMMAAQLAAAGRPGSVTWLDRSAAALAIAQSRAQARGLQDAIRWEARSLLDLPGSGLGPFDYVDCCGVLHHLPDPEAGLRALASVLAPRGGIGLMVYAPHGRTGVYMVQDALRHLAPPHEPPAARLDVARRVMRHLPQTSWLRANTNFGDHLTGGDAGLYDLLLNPRDRAYTIDALLALLERCGLRATCLVEPARYDPALLLPDPRLRARAEALDPAARAALAEALAGNMSTHVLYCVRADDPWTPPDPMREDAVPVARETPAAELARGIRPDGTLPMLFDGLRLVLPLPSRAAAILALVDGSRSVGEILAALVARGATLEQARAAWAETYARLNSVNRLLLAAPG